MYDTPDGSERSRRRTIDTSTEVAVPLCVVRRMREFTPSGWKVFSYMVLHSWAFGLPYRAFSLDELTQGVIRIKVGTSIADTLDVDTDSEASAGLHGLEREDSGCGISSDDVENWLTVLEAKSFVVRHKWILTGDTVYLVNWKHLGLL